MPALERVPQCVVVSASGESERDGRVRGVRSMAAAGPAWVPAIGDDATAQHLALEPAEKWRRHASRPDYTYIVRGGFALPPSHPENCVARPGMIGRVTMHGRRSFLWEIGPGPSYAMREQLAASASGGIFGVIVVSSSPRTVVESFANGKQATEYGGAPMFGCGNVEQQLNRLREPHLYLNVGDALPGSHCGQCKVPFPAEDVGQVYDVLRLCRLCLHAVVAANARRLPAVIARTATGGARTAASPAEASPDLQRARDAAEAAAIKARTVAERLAEDKVRQAEPLAAASFAAAGAAKLAASAFAAADAALRKATELVPAGARVVASPEATEDDDDDDRAAGAAATKAAAELAAAPLREAAASAAGAAKQALAASAKASEAASAAAISPMLLADARDVGASLQVHLRCGRCSGPVAFVAAHQLPARTGHMLVFVCGVCPSGQKGSGAAAGATLCIPTSSAAKGRFGDRLALSVCMSGATFSQIETVADLCGFELPIASTAFYSKAQPAMAGRLADARNAMLADNLEVAKAAGVPLTAAVDHTYSHRRGAHQSTAVMLDAKTGKFLEVEHALLPRGLDKEKADKENHDPRRSYHVADPKALEGNAMELIAPRLVANGVAVGALVKDDDSSSMDAIARLYTSVRENLDTNHVLKAFEKAVRSAVRDKVKGLEGRAVQLRVHLQRLLQAGTVRPELFGPLCEAFVRHLQGDHAQCPTVVTCGPSGVHDGCHFHCYDACQCLGRCDERGAVRSQEMASHRRGKKPARFTLLHAEVWFDRSKGSYVQGDGRGWLR